MDYRIEQILFYYSGVINGWYETCRYELVLDSLINNILEDSVSRHARELW